MSLVSALPVALLLALTSLQSNFAAAATAQPSIVVLGDSVSSAFGLPEDAGWVALLQAKLDKNHYSFNIINASVTGETTSGGASRIEALLADYQPRIVIVELGGNDGLRGLSLKSMRQNLQRIVQSSQASNARVLLLGMQIPANYGRTYTSRFREMYGQIAEQYTVALVPFIFAGFALNPQMMQGDGIHPGAAAQSIMLDHVWSALTPLIQQAQ